MSEVMSKKAGLVNRLKVLGATDDEIAAVVDAWDEPDYVDDRNRLMGLSDHALRAEIIGVRTEHLRHTTLPTEPATLPLEAAAVVEGTVEAVKEWVGGSAERAAAAGEAERARAKPRITLLTWLDALVPA